MTGHIGWSSKRSVSLSHHFLFPTIFLCCHANESTGNRSKEKTVERQRQRERERSLANETAIQFALSELFRWVQPEAEPVWNTEQNWIDILAHRVDWSGDENERKSEWLGKEFLDRLGSFNHSWCALVSNHRVFENERGSCNNRLYRHAWPRIPNSFDTIKRRLSKTYSRHTNF